MMAKLMPCGHAWSVYVSIDIHGDSFLCGICNPIGKRIAQLEADSEMLLAMLEVDQSAFIAITEQLNEHPEGYERACLCATCRSYA